MSRSHYLAGINAAQLLLRRDPTRIKRVLIDERSKNARLESLADEARNAGLAVEGRRSHALDQLAAAARHQGVVLELTGSWQWDEARLKTEVEARLTANSTVLLLVLDKVTDPHNLGACLRSAAAAGVDALILPQAGSAELTPAARKVASGAAEIVPIVRVPVLARCCGWLRSYGVRVVGAEGDAEHVVWDADLTLSTALVVGAEGEGLSPNVRSVCDGLVRIPMETGFESLNVSVATGVLLFEARRQRAR